ncbi:serine hydrolase domain-containing protein [Serratia sp. root2]|uniref:serine hydrolase domain-containing protein n=1 Tax=Serratia sp. root2 TaxID=3059676 RepID=UPI00288D9E25|nr:serine hydrolase domain-containing protein [Serratia sp. root2]MDT3250590.1 serine hydrolase domain-containing protein [Serratia sp. root2]
MKIKIPLKCCVALGIPLLISACGSLSRMPTDVSPLESRRLACSGDLQAEVDSLARPMIDGHQTPGLVVGILTPNGQARTFGYGVTDTRQGYPMNGNTLFAVGSVSKGFIAEVTVVLVNKGVLHWNDTLATLLPAGTPLSPDAAKITLLQLVTHTSGLPRQMMTPDMLGAFARYLFTGDNFYRSLDTPKFLDYLAHFDAPTVEEPRYSNLGYALLDYILQRRTGKTVDRLTTENILQPLGLTHTRYDAQQLPGYPQRAIGHAGDQPKFIRRGQPVPDWRFSSYMLGAAGLYTDADDLLRYARAHVEPTGSAALDKALKDSLTVRFARSKEAAAIAWVVDDVGAQQITYQVGFIGGYSSYIGLDLRHKTAVVVLQNSFNWTNNIGHRLLQRMGEAADRHFTCQ